MKYDDGTNNMGFTAHFRIKSQEIIWGAISKAGFSVGRLKITTDSLFFMDKFNKEYYAYTFDELNHEMGIQTNYQMIEDFIMGNPVIEFNKEDQLEKGSESFTITAQRLPFIITNEINKSFKRVTKVQVENKEVPDNTVEVDYTDFKSYDRNNFPNKTKIVAQGVDQENNALKINVELDHSKVKFTKNQLNFPFSISDSYVKKN